MLIGPGNGLVFTGTKFNETPQGVGKKCDTEKIFEALPAAYDGDERQYHNMAHIE